MVYKRYIYRNGKKFGPYYYHSYRKKGGRTFSRYVKSHEVGRAVTDSHKIKSSGSRHLLIFILAATIIAIVLGVFVLNYQFKDEGRFSFEKIGKDIYGAVTGFTSEEPEPVQTVEETSTLSQSDSEDGGASEPISDESSQEQTTQESSETEIESVIDSTGVVDGEDVESSGEVSIEDSADGGDLEIVETENDGEVGGQTEDTVVSENESVEELINGSSSEEVDEPARSSCIWS